ncbi:MAG: hypothetical protein JWR36_120 [Glaciihabitans sp.]|nr:hypothetical protein [Glaciihabitans sp.]MDQ1571602.1 hypothetical protein [Actinomycetota bacterium]
MAHQAAINAWEDLTIELQDEDGVRVESEGLLVHERLFAFLDDDDLIVDVPATRADDLVSREIAVRFKLDAHPSREWIRVSDIQLWPELAREAHEYVGEPPVGGQS